MLDAYGKHVKAKQILALDAVCDRIDHADADVGCFVSAFCKIVTLFGVERQAVILDVQHHFIVLTDHSDIDGVVFLL